MNPDEKEFTVDRPAATSDIATHLRQALNHYAFLKPWDIACLAAATIIKTFQAGEHLIRAGEYNYNVILVLKGLLRSYLTDENGDERTVRFVPEKKNAGSSQTILRDQPSVENIVALEKSWVVVGDFRTFEKLAQKHPALLQYENKALKELLATTIDQTWFHIRLSPEQRYLTFCKEYPNLEQRVTQKDLASYLGITATSLSRIRARIAQSSPAGGLKGSGEGGRTNSLG